MDGKNKKMKRERSTAWAMINWGIVQDLIETSTGISPDQISIEEALGSVEMEYSEEELFLLEAKTLEKLLIQRLTKILYKNRGKEIKKKKAVMERTRNVNQNRLNSKGGFQVFPMGSVDDLKKMGMDPEMMEQFSKSLMDQLFRKRKKKDKKDNEEDDDEDAGASFYM